MKRQGFDLKFSWTKRDGMPSAEKIETAVEAATARFDATVDDICGELEAVTGESYIFCNGGFVPLWEEYDAQGREDHQRSEGA